MNIDYSKYYWKNSLITLRQPTEADWQELVHKRSIVTYYLIISNFVDRPSSVPTAAVARFRNFGTIVKSAPGLCL